MIHQKSFNIKSVVLYILAFLGPLSATFLDKPNLVLLIAIFFSAFTLIFIHQGSFFCNQLVKVFIISYLVILLISTVGGFTVSGVYANDEQLGKTLSRTVTMCLGVVILLIVGDWAETNGTKNSFKLFIKISFISTAIFAVLGIYQIIADKLSLPFLETRSLVYGTEFSIRESLGFRLTSIAREPNFYSPILFESLCLAFAFLNRNKFLMFFVLTLFLMFKTLSTGVYMHAILFFFAIFVFSKINPVYKIGICVLFCISFIVFLVINVDSLWFQYFLSKLDAEASGASLRSNVYGAVFSVFSSASIINLLFGHGLNSLSSFNDFSNAYQNLNFAISNNLYLDFLWDSGVIGLGSYLVCAFFVFRTLSAVRGFNKYGFSAFMMFVSLLISSLYRSEYTTTHFYWVLSNIIILYYLAKKEPRNDA